MRSDIRRDRLARAVVIVALVVLVVPVTNFAVERHSDAHARDPGSGLVRFPQLGATGDPFEVLQAVDDSMQLPGASVPGYFDDEIGLPDGCRDVRTDGESVVGCVVDDEASETMRAIDEHMRNEGWSSVPLGETEGATYVKEGGACQWTLVTCTQVGNASSVVYRCIVR